MQKEKTTAYLYLHLAVFLWGFTAILGKLISYGSLNLVWHRMLLAGLVFMFFPGFWRGLKKISIAQIFQLSAVGILVTLHWLTFYGSIKIGNSVSITLACLGSSSLFAAFFDPWITRRPFRVHEILLGLLVLVGLGIIYFAKSENTNLNQTHWAILVGVCSAALAALFSTINKRFVSTVEPLTISGIEIITGGILLSVLALVEGNSFPVLVPKCNIGAGQMDMIWVLILVLICTNFTFWISLISLKHISAFTSNLIINLEPIYGIILGALIFKEYEQLNSYFYVGASLIILAVFMQPFLQKKRESK